MEISEWGKRFGPKDYEAPITIPEDGCTGVITGIIGRADIEYPIQVREYPIQVRWRMRNGDTWRDCDYKPQEICHAHFQF